MLFIGKLLLYMFTLYMLFGSIFIFPNMILLPDQMVIRNAFNIQKSNNSTNKTNFLSLPNSKPLVKYDKRNPNTLEQELKPTINLVTKNLKLSISILDPINTGSSFEDQEILEVMKPLNDLKETQSRLIAQANLDIRADQEFKQLFEYSKLPADQPDAIKEAFFKDSEKLKDQYLKRYSQTISKELREALVITLENIQNLKGEYINKFSKFLDTNILNIKSENTETEFNSETQVIEPKYIKIFNELHDQMVDDVREKDADYIENLKTIQLSGLETILEYRALPLKKLANKRVIEIESKLLIELTRSLNKTFDECEKEFISEIENLKNKNSLKEVSESVITLNTMPMGHTENK